MLQRNIPEYVLLHGIPGHATTTLFENGRVTPYAYAGLLTECVDLAVHCIAQHIASACSTKHHGKIMISTNKYLLVVLHDGAVMGNNNGD